jgi:hypothetical protein
MGLLAAAADAITLKVGNVGGERRRAEGAATMADDTSLHDDAAMSREEPATAECGVSSPKCRVSVSREPPPASRIQTAIAYFPGGTQHLVDKALTATTIADASQPDIEIFIAAIHRCDPGGIFLGPVPE